MIVTHHPLYTHQLPQGHRFPMEKYCLLNDQLKTEGLDQDFTWTSPQAIKEEHILRVHDNEYISRLSSGNLTRKEERASGFKWSKTLLQREKCIMEGTRMCAVEASRGGVALNIAGGTHHAFRDRPEGFCLLNDLVISAAYLIRAQLSKRILIVDLDVHQGNGTASLASDFSGIFTLSIHCADNYPFHKEQSDLDIALPSGIQDQAYLAALDQALATSFSEFQPDVVLYQCGVDVLATDKLGKLCLTPAGCAERDRRVFAACQKHGIGAACTMGGGYSPNVNDIVAAHMNTFYLARNFWT